MSFARLEHSGAAVRTTLAAGVGTGDTTLVIVASTNWPTGSVGPFYAVINPGEANAEVVLCTARSGTSLTGVTRGQDGFSAATHASGEPIVHVFPAVEADEANNLVKQTLGTVTTKGDGLFATGAGALGRRSVGANDTLLIADSAQATGVKWGTVPTAGITDAAVTAAKIASAVAGNGLAGGAGTALSVNVDDSTIELNSDALRLKDAGITAAKFAAAVRPTFLAADAAARTALEGAAVAGDRVYQTDTKRVYGWDGAAWVFLESLASGEGKVVRIDPTAVTGTATSGTTEKTLATVNIAAQHAAYKLDVAAFWTGAIDTAGADYDFRIRVAGFEAAKVRARNAGGVNGHHMFSIPTCDASVAADTGVAVTVTIQRAGGTGTIDTVIAGLVRCVMYF